MLIRPPAQGESRRLPTRDCWPSRCSELSASPADSGPGPADLLTSAALFLRRPAPPVLSATAQADPSWLFQARPCARGCSVWNAIWTAQSGPRRRLPELPLQDRAGLWRGARPEPQVLAAVPQTRPVHSSCACAFLAPCPSPQILAHGVSREAQLQHDLWLGAPVGQNRCSYLLPQYFRRPFMTG